jgi:hypothetical protein
MTRRQIPEGGGEPGGGGPDSFGSRRASLRSCPYCTMPMVRHCTNAACRWVVCRCGAILDPQRGASLPPHRDDG